MATASSRGNSNAVGKIVGPKSATSGGGNINPRGEVGRPGDPGGHMWPKAPVQRLNPSGKTMGQIAGEVANNIKTQSTDGGVLGQAHMGGHSDVGNSSILKTPVKPNISLKNK